VPGESLDPDSLPRHGRFGTFGLSPQNTPSFFPAPSSLARLIGLEDCVARVAGLTFEPHKARRYTLGPRILGVALELNGPRGRGRSTMRPRWSPSGTFRMRAPGQTAAAMAHLLNRGVPAQTLFQKCSTSPRPSPFGGTVTVFVPSTGSEKNGRSARTSVITSAALVPRLGIRSRFPDRVSG
jgi:hypothetical protein